MTRRRKQAGFVARLFGRRRGGRNRRPGARAKFASLIGSDLASMHVHRTTRRRWLPLLVGALLAALCLTALRIDLLRQRYDLAAAMTEEKQLLEERRLLTARVRRLRDPARLAEFAKQRGFERPTRVILLDAPSVALGPRP